MAAALEEPANELWLSPVVIWEVLTLAEKGRVELEPDAVTWIRQVLRTIPFREASLTHEVGSCDFHRRGTRRPPKEAEVTAVERVSQPGDHTAGRGDRSEAGSSASW